MNKIKFNEEIIRSIMNGKIDELNEKHNMGIEKINELPIKFNNSIQSRGSFTYQYKHNGRRGKYRVIKEIVPLYFTFSTVAFQDLDDKDIIDLIYHELAHYIANTHYKDICNHDKRWTKICMLIGMKDISATFSYTKEEKEKKYNYKTICPHCGATTYNVRITQKKLNGIKEGHYICGRCEKHGLEVIDIKNGKVIAKDGNTTTC